jgi:UDP-N-acetylmuramoyl-tripeptide--D-alanyl-D-alanine ligase
LITFQILHSLHYEIDSRLCNKNSIFVALETGSRSGADFINNAINNGAMVVISQKEMSGIKTSSPVNFNGIKAHEYPINIVVEDTLAYIQNLAKTKFHFLKNSGVKTIAITGSVGKTTTKECVACTLEKYGKVYATQGNFNNHIGLPLTVLNAPDDINFLILEMGMNHIGEIEFLASIAPCDRCLITNVRENHIGNFQDGERGVLCAKFEILQTGGKCFVLRETYEAFMQNEYLMGYHGLENLVCVDVLPVVKHCNNQTKIFLDGRDFVLDGIYSQAQVNMLCLAIYCMDDTLDDRVQEVLLPAIKGRGDVVIWNGINIIDESYNASPTSIKNALGNLQKFDGKSLCILGEMRELGKNSKKYHNALAGSVKKFDVILVGEEMRCLKGMVWFEDYSSCLKFLKNNKEMLLQYKNILVKGSNGVLLWKLFNEFFI